LPPLPPVALVPPAGVHACPLVWVWRASEAPSRCWASRAHLVRVHHRDLVLAEDTCTHPHTHTRLNCVSADSWKSEPRSSFTSIDVVLVFRFPAAPPHRPRKDGLAHPADSSRTIFLLLLCLYRAKPYPKQRVTARSTARSSSPQGNTRGNLTGCHARAATGLSQRDMQVRSRVAVALLAGAHRTPCSCPCRWNP
jgi:hypothetical protein